VKVSAADYVQAHKQAMQKANQSAQNCTRRLSQETCKNYRSRIITYHSDGTVTFWDVSNQAWARTANPTDQQVSGLPHAEVDRIRRYLQNRVNALTMR
jgi:hypothetical protein